MLQTPEDFIARMESDSPAFIIAEGADAHYGELNRARAMVDAAVLAGADAIKFQHHLPDEEMLRSTPMSSNMSIPLYDFLVQNALSIEEHEELSNYASLKGITYLCTPFSLKAAEELESRIGLPAYKIGSGELTDTPTLDRIAAFGKPMILSTGMSTIDEIDVTYEQMCAASIPFALLNCTSAYPPKPSDVSLGFISVMRDRYPRAWIGHSDHTPDITTAIAAIALGARIVEKHVTVDAALSGPDAEVSISFDDLRKLVEASRIIHQASSSVKEVKPSEQEIRVWARRSLVYLQDLNEGTVLNEACIWGKRPGTGIPSSRIDEFLGRRLTRAVRKDSFVSHADIS